MRRTIITAALGLLLVFSLSGTAGATDSGRQTAEAVGAAEGEAEHTPSPVTDFTIILGIAAAGAAVGFIACRTARSRG